MRLRNRRSTDPELGQRVHQALQRLRKLLPLDECDVELRTLQDGVATVKVVGACPHCRMDGASLSAGIEAHLLNAVPELVEIRIEGSPSVRRD